LGDLPCPALSAKIFLFSFEPNHLLIDANPCPMRGAFRDRHGVGRGKRWTREQRLTRAANADGEVVWTVKQCNTHQLQRHTYFVRSNL